MDNTFKLYLIKESDILIGQANQCHVVECLEDHLNCTSDLSDRVYDLYYNYFYNISVKYENDNVCFYTTYHGTNLDFYILKEDLSKKVFKDFLDNLNRFTTFDNFGILYNFYHNTLNNNEPYIDLKYEEVVNLYKSNPSYDNELYLLNKTIELAKIASNNDDEETSSKYYKEGLKILDSLNSEYLNFEYIMTYCYINMANDSTKDTIYNEYYKLGMEYSKKFYNNDKLNVSKRLTYCDTIFQLNLLSNSKYPLSDEDCKFFLDTMRELYNKTKCPTFSIDLKEGVNAYLFRTLQEGRKFKDTKFIYELIDHSTKLISINDNYYHHLLLALSYSVLSYYNLNKKQYVEAKISLLNELKELEKSLELSKLKTKQGDDRVYGRIDKNISIKEFILQFIANSCYNISNIERIYHHSDEEMEYLEKYIKTQLKIFKFPGAFDDLDSLEKLCWAMNYFLIYQMQIMSTDFDFINELEQKLYDYSKLLIKEIKDDPDLIKLHITACNNLASSNKFSNDTLDKAISLFKEMEKEVCKIDEISYVSETLWWTNYNLFTIARIKNEKADIYALKALEHAKKVDDERASEEDFKAINSQLQDYLKIK